MIDALCNKKCRTTLRRAAKIRSNKINEQRVKHAHAWCEGAEEKKSAGERHGQQLGKKLPQAKSLRKCCTCSAPLHAAYRYNNGAKSVVRGLCHALPTPVLQKCAEASENGEVLEVNKRQPNLKREKEPLKERETNVLCVLIF